ncbi:MAG: arginyltransferase [Hyphomicrobiales bacterium]|nr:MAG: arginyltransferase [Hyphomicrobiales bacterium]
MTRHMIDNPQFYLTAPAVCPYLADRMERKVFTHLIGERAATLNDILTQGGFRRSQNIAYRPACENCRSCVSVRVVVDAFHETKSFRRVEAANTDIIGTEMALEPTSEQYDLFRDYLDARHADGGMADMSVKDYAMMIEDTHVDTMIVEYRPRGVDSGITGVGDGPLLGVALTDILSDGLSMVYSFFDTSRPERSFGTYMILEHIRRARRMGLPYVYLGYWVEGSTKMDYKARFRPQEMLTAHGWIRQD